MATIRDITLPADILLFYKQNGVDLKNILSITSLNASKLHFILLRGRDTIYIQSWKYHREQWYMQNELPVITDTVGFQNFVR